MLNLFKSKRAAVPRDQVPAGVRAYAVGDIHGRLDLLDRLLERIDADDAARGPAETWLVFLGDLVDRGPDSAGVVDRLRRLAQAPGGRTVRFLAGNHEEMFLDALAGDASTVRLFARVGGRETALSYGITPERYNMLEFEELAAELAALVPPEHVAFLRGFEGQVTLGDYAFVHAGIHPDRPLAIQKAADLRWIRDPFLRHRARFEKRIVHGHTITDEVEVLPNRIGIDTGAYLSGRLTALGLEGEEQWFLQT
jgi:serine/threonine protein phosphatase 1